MPDWFIRITKSWKFDQKVKSLNFIQLEKYTHERTKSKEKSRNWNKAEDVIKNFPLLIEADIGHLLLTDILVLAKNIDK